MSEYTSCHWIQHGLSFETDHIEMCCLCCHKGGGKLYIKENYNGKNTNWDDIFNLKQKFIEENKQGKIDKRCEGCFNLINGSWAEEKQYINFIHFNHFTKCNCDCIYCYTSFDKKNYQKNPNYNVMPVIKELIKRKQFKTNGEITFAGGEPTILKEFDELVNFLIKNGAERIVVHSSGIKYSKSIERGIRDKHIRVCLSADSGTKETYKRIKRVDKFDKFWENAKRYAKAQTDEAKYNVETKFILIPEVNTTVEEINKWFELNIQSGIHSVIIDIENDFYHNLILKNEEKPKYLVDLCDYIIQRAKELNLKLIGYNNFVYFMNKYELRLRDKNENGNI